MKNQEAMEALNGLLDDIAIYTEKRHDDEIRLWLMAATLRIWAGNKLFAEEYVRVLPVFKDQEYTTAQVITALDCAGDETREMDIPEFFQCIVKRDIERHTSESRSIADAIGRFLVLLALINGDFTVEEASALRSISDLLLGYCDHQGVVAGKTREYHPEMVTPLNKTGYYQQAPDIKKKTADNEKKTELVNSIPGGTPPVPKKEDVVPTLTLNLNLVPEQPAESSTAASVSGVIVKKPTSNNEDSEETLESVLAKLHGLVGLDKVKNDVRSLLNFIKICQLRTERNESSSHFLSPGVHR